MKSERHWWRDEPTPAQYKALKALAKTPNGCAYAGNLSRFGTLGTLRAMHRLGLVTANTPAVQTGTVVTLTEHGRTCASQHLLSEESTPTPAADREGKR